MNTSVATVTLSLSQLRLVEGALKRHRAHHLRRVGGDAEKIGHIVDQCDDALAAVGAAISRAIAARRPVT